MAPYRRDGIDDSVSDKMSSSKQPRKQRRARYNAHPHKRRMMIASHLSDQLIKDYNVRAMPVRKGDLIKVVRGNKEIKGKECLVTDVFTKDLKIGLEGITIKKADGSEVVRKMDPSNVIIVKFDLSDPKRREKLERLKSGGSA